MKGKRVALYCRVSTKLDGQKTSLEAQKEQENIIKSAGGILFDTYMDTKSAKNINREELQRMLKDCRDGKIDVVYTKNLSRLARNVKDLLTILEELESLGIVVIFAEDGIRTDKAMSKVVITILGAVAEMERNNTSEHIKESYAIKRANGQPAKDWAAPFGYIRSKQKDGSKKTVINEEEAAIVRQIFKWYIENHYSCDRICNELYARGLTNSKGNAWERSTVLNMIKNKKYIGIIEEEGVEYPGLIPAIIDREQFDTAQHLLKNRRRGVDTSKNFATQLYALSQKCKCGLCGDTCSRGGHQSPYSDWEGLVDEGDKNLRSWQCKKLSRRKRSKPCGAKPMSEYWLYKALIIIIADLILKGELEIPEVSPEEIGYDAQIAAIEKKKKGLAKRRQRVLDMIEHDIISESEGKNRLIKIDEEEAAIVMPELPEKQRIEADFVKAINLLKAIPEQVGVETVAEPKIDPIITGFKNDLGIKDDPVKQYKRLLIKKELVEGKLLEMFQDEPQKRLFVQVVVDKIVIDTPNFEVYTKQGAIYHVETKGRSPSRDKTGKLMPNQALNVVRLN